MTNSIDVWTVPIDANDAAAVGQLKRVSEAVGPHLYPSLSEDGKLLAYSSTRQGHGYVWIKNLESGKESRVVTHTETEGVGQLSPDGSLVTYVNSGSSTGGFVVPVQGGTTRQFCTGECSPYSISRDNKVVLYRFGKFLRAFNLDSGQDGLFLHSANYHLYQSVFSPDQRWVVFEAVHRRRSRLYVAAVRDGAPSLSEKDWIPLTADEGWADKPRWSPDGKWIYFISNRDGFFCLWAQRLAGETKRAEGLPVPITHFHGSRLSIDNVGPGSRMQLSVARDKIALNLGELTGNVWVTDLSR
jgi:Tol biopolymer transport system component